MIATTRLLTTGFFVSAAVSRNVRFVANHHQFKIVPTTDDTLRISRKPWKNCCDPDNFGFTTAVQSDEDSMPTDGACQPQAAKSQMETFFNAFDAQIEHPGILVDSKNIVNVQDPCDAMGASKKSQRPSMTKQKYNSIRPWKPLRTAASGINNEAHFVMRVLSYNILAQNLLETHFYLYRDHNKQALKWNSRMILLQQEILRTQATVICLQEMQEDHLDHFLVAFKMSGYDYIYKKRTNDKTDGLLLLYQSRHMKLVDCAKVELYQENVNILNRDNVAIVAKFSLTASPETQFVVSTTHLLYNPKREDVRLAQTQVLFAELERLAFDETNKDGQARYLPIILTGDFNLQPQSGVYRFITEGAFEYKNRGRNLEPALICGLGNSLVPSFLLVTDNCQHYNTLVERSRSEVDEATTKMKKDEDCESDDCVIIEKETDNKGKVDTRTFEYQKVKIVEGQYAEFSSGALTHPLNLSSLYRHTNDQGQSEATTHQNKWVTVDYIFYSDVQPLEKYNLPTVDECESLPTIPNAVVGSDHLCIGATFRLALKKKNR